MHTAVLDGFRIDWVAGAPGTSQVGILEHVQERQDGTWITPLGHVAVYFAPALPEEAAHWQAECLLRSDVRFGERVVVGPEVSSGTPNYPPRLLDALIDALLAERRVEQPVLLNVHHGTNVDYRQRGQILDDD